jgi:polyisoprenoid-binding protein YceI
MRFLQEAAEATERICCNDRDTEATEEIPIGCTAFARCINSGRLSVASVSSCSNAVSATSCKSALMQLWLRLGLGGAIEVVLEPWCHGGAKPKLTPAIPASAPFAFREVLHTDAGTMKRAFPILSALLACAWLPAARAAVETYKIDPVHSSVGFSIRHFFSNVPGSFTKFAGTIRVDRDDLERSSVEATIETPTVDTRNEMRDKDLRSDHYFAVDQFPTITFKSKSWKKNGDGAFDVTGDLMIHGITKEVVLKTKSLGFGPGMKGAMLSGWQATTTLNRNDFGLTSIPAVLGAEVEVSISIEADLQK